MAFHQPELGAQLYKDSLSFMTKTGQNNNVPKGSTKGFFFQFLVCKLLIVHKVNNTSMFPPLTKTKKGNVCLITSKSDPFLLDITDESKPYLLT